MAVSATNPNGMQNYGVYALMTHLEYLDKHAIPEEKKETFALQNGGSVEVAYLIMEGVIDEKSLSIVYKVDDSKKT
jgi:hypothetical protein